MIAPFQKLLLFFSLVSGFFFFSCKKSNSNTSNNNQIVLEQVSIEGKWTVVYYDASKITATNSSDTTYPAHNEYRNYTADSILTDSWYSISYNTTVFPTQISVSDTAEDLYGLGYVRDGKSLYETENGFVVDTLYIDKLTDKELLLHYQIPQGDGFDKLYIYLKK